MDLPLLQSEWVLWLLIALSIASIAVCVERAIFYARRGVDIDAVRTRVAHHLDRGDHDAAARYLQEFDTLETNVVLFGLRDSHKGPDAVEDLLAGAMTRERERYERSLTFLATIGSNAPFIGLFGTVLGIIRAFKDLSGNLAEGSASVMGGISEALVATAVGLLVAIPAVIAFNAFKTQVKRRVGNAELLGRVVLSFLKAEPAQARAAAEVA